MADSASSFKSSTSPTVPPQAPPSTLPAGSPTVSIPTAYDAKKQDITKAREAGLVDGIRTIRPSDLTEVHLKPCARESFMTGIGAGFGIGGIRFIIGGGQFKAMNWAVGAFCLTSAGAFAFCQEKRRLEKLAMERAKEIMERKKAEKIEQERERRRKIMAERDLEKEKNRGWFGFGGNSK